MRYFMSISDAKVDMLLPQVPGAHRKKIAAKLGFDIKLLSGSLEMERATLDNRIARLEAVETYIRETETIGTPGEPQSWIAGDVEASVADIGEGAIMFVAGTREWMLGLGGSEHHLIGSVRRDDVRVGYSFLPVLIEMLKSMDAKEWQFALTQPDSVMPTYWTAGLGSGAHAWVALIREAYYQAIAPPQRVMFLAKRLLSEQIHFGPSVTLATPLYVSLQN